MGDLGGELGGGDLGDELGGGDLGDLGDEDLGGEDLGGEEEGGDEGPLLAAPAKRDDRDRKNTKNSLSKKAKGKTYVSKKHRGGDSRSGRQHNYSAMAIPKPRDITPGMSDMMGLSRGIYEVEEPIYSEEESLLFEARSEIRDLVTELENSEIQLDENETQQEA